MTSRLPAGAAVALFLPFAATAAGTPAVDFLRDVKPVLADACFACHGPDPTTRKAGLRLDIRDEALKPAESGERPVVPGKSAESEVVRRLLSDDPNEVMPPPASNKKLTAAQRELLKRWVDGGAEYKQHWAFVKPERPAVPAVKDAGRVATPVDAFVLARLEKLGLTLSKEADRATLVRRVSLDLRGFGPSADEVRAFLADDRPDAYGRMVDRMLASPHYGEKMAQLWLDLARFGDTSGYHFDSTRQMWLWRDWVIDAYNRNLPYDRFTVEQLAGDLLPNPTRDQRIASGFNRNTRFNEEGGADPEEFVVRYTVDRTNTLGQVWLGMTLGCAECHSHKYDPVTHAEYYRLYAFFAGVKEPMVSMNHNQPLPPLLKVPTPEHESELAAARRALDAARERVTAALAKVSYREPDVVAAKPAEPADVAWVDDALPAGASPVNDGGGPWPWADGGADRPVFSGSKSMKRSGPGLHQHYFTGAKDPVALRAGDTLFAYVWLDPKAPPRSVMLQFHSGGSWEHRAYWGADECFLKGSPDAPNHRKAGDLPKAGAWARLEIDPAKVGLKAGNRVDGWAFTQFDGTAYYDKAGVRTTPGDDRQLLSQKAWEERAKSDAKLPAAVKAALQVAADQREAKQQAAARDHYVRFVYGPARATFDPLNREVEEVEKRVKAVEDSVPTVMVSEEMEKPRDAFVLIRGDFLQRGEKVTPDVPAVFPRLPAGRPKNRLALAEWLVSPDHPLTARVAVNRLWMQMFGTGLVRTPGDFGTQGDYPSHPELLDWLATEYVRVGWDTKAVLKLIAMSSAYRQASAFAGAVPDADPNNRLLYRAPRFRLSAEEVRDNALKVAGLLSPKVGGPSVMPYQPGDFYKGKNEGWQWNLSGGEGLYRRGLYTFWRRTSLHPMYAIFDAPSREECSVARPRTNTPLQALVTLNDPTFVEAARVFAERVLAEGPADAAGRAAFAFRAALVRDPSPAEASALVRRYAQLKARYAADPVAAAALAKAGRRPPAKHDAAELAAWTGVANVLLNLDETVTRE